MSARIPIALSLLFLGALIIAINVPVLQGKVKRNSVYGIRTPKAFESDELWFKINRYGARQMMLWSAVTVVLGIATFFIPFANPAQLIVWFSLASLLPLLVAYVQIFRYSNKL